MRKIVSSLLAAAAAVVMAVGQLPALPVSAESSEPKLIALTFDDGPNTTTTNDVLDILEKYHAKASFFLIGDNINAESAASVKRAYDMGMEIGNHSKTHANMSKMTAEEMQAEISFVDDKVMEITGEPTRFFRPPFIDVSPAMYEAIDKPFICGIDCQDYMANVTAQQRADYILNGARDGVIVLLHDAAGNDQTVEALRIVMPELTAQGYEFVTLSELFERQGETPRHGLIYSNVGKYPSGYTLRQELAADAPDRISLDGALLQELGDTYAVEVDYESESGYPPVIALQKWSGSTPIWHTIQPFYFNGEKAVFLAEDVQAPLQQLEVTYSDLDGIAVTAYSGAITFQAPKLLVSGTEAAALQGDVNTDGSLDLRDLILLQKWLLAVPGTHLNEGQAGDLNGDNVLDTFDLCLMKRRLLDKAA